MKNNTRTVNRNLVNALIAYNGLTLVSLGRMCDPPVTNAAVCMYLAGKIGDDRIGIQISNVLEGIVNDLQRDLAGIQNGNISEILFPYSQDNPNNISVTEEKQDAFPERKENFNDKTGASGFCGEADTAPHVGSRE